MAYTRIHAIKSTVQKSVDYICDPDKTLDGLFVSSFSCTPRFAGAEFKSALSNTNSFDENKAYHLIQSFAPERYPMRKHTGSELSSPTGY